MKTTFTLIEILYLAIFIACTPQPKQEYTTFAELTDTKTFDTLAWEAVPEGLNASIGNIDTRYQKRSVPKFQIKKSWEGTAWKGERANVQFVLWTTKDLKQVTCLSSDLKDEMGNTITSENINTFFVRYVMTDEYTDGCGPRNPADYDSSLVADAIDPIPYFDIEGQTTRPVWVTVDVPKDAVAGNYSGKITVNTAKQKKVVLNVQLKVQDKILPEPDKWAFHLDLWQNPFAVARYHKVELWSAEHFKLLRPLMEMLGDAGQKCITASIMHRPWGGQTFDQFESLIKWNKNADSTWSFDYSLFDNWVEFAMDCGITQQINCYTMIPWGNQFTYFDESINKETTITTTPGTLVYEEIWTSFLQQFTEHLKDKGWDKITTIAMDERALEDMQKMIAFLHSVAPEIKITLAGDFHEEINNDIYDLCVASKHIVPLEEIKKRNEKGLRTTYYVCCVEQYPNNFTFSPPAEGVYQGWFAAAKGFNGFLRWAYNSWVENPLTDSRFRTWPAGDTYFVYPGAISSIRFERLREGIQDFEKIRILRSELQAQGSDEAMEKLRQLDELLAQFEISNLKDTPAEQFVNEGKALLEKLSD